MGRRTRMAIITTGLVGTGAFAGALLGVLVLTFGGLPEVSAYGATFGAILGAGLAPLIGWLLLRRLPLGQAIGGTFLGSAAGATFGSIAGVDGSILGTLVGFVSSVLWMRVSLQRNGSVRRLTLPPPNNSLQATDGTASGHSEAAVQPSAPEA